MQSYFDVVQDRSGRSIAGASVTVYTASNTLATLYSNNGVTTTSNPLTTNGDGEYFFYAANGTYRVEIAATGYTGQSIPGVVLFDPSDGTANGVLFLNGSKAVTTGSGLTFDGTNLGIGASSPGAKLQVGDAGSAAPVKILIRTAPADTYLQSTTTGSVFGTPNNVPLLFNTNDAEKMRLDASGNLGLGTSSPSSFDGNTKLVVGTGSGAPAITLYGGNATYSSLNFADGITGNETYRGFIEYDHASDSMRVGTSGTTKATLDSSGNLGLGVTPSAWGGSYKAFENAAGFYGSFSTNVLIMGQNWYDSGAGSYLYRATGFASYYSQANGEHRFYNAPSGTAGDAISFTQAMTLDASGNLSVGTTTTPTQITFAGGSGITYQRSTNNSFSGVLDYLKSRGSAASPTAVQNGDDLFTLRVAPHHGSAYTYLTNTVVQVDGIFTSGQNPPTRIAWYTNTANGSSTERMRITSTGNIVAGASAALATTATDGFIYVPTCAGTPTGTPTAITGMVPIVVNTTNNKLYFYSGGAWRDAGP